PRLLLPPLTIHRIPTHRQQPTPNTWQTFRRCACSTAYCRRAFSLSKTLLTLNTVRGNYSLIFMHRHRPWLTSDRRLCWYMEVVVGQFFARTCCIWPISWPCVAT